jgi:hypothetical protein
VKPLEDLPTSFWVLSDKGGENQLKLQGQLIVFHVSIMSGKIELSGFANRIVQFWPIE